MALCNWNLSALAVAATMAVGCGIGNAGETLGTPGVPGQTSESDLVCEAQLALSGTRSPDGPIPPEGCMPGGVWQVNVQVVNPGNCGTQINVLPTYTYDVRRDGDTWETDYQTQGGEEFSGKVIAAGGDCTGSFLHISQDGLTVVNLNPFERNQQISGSGTFEVYVTPQ